jgi:hypothetical protein
MCTIRHTGGSQCDGETCLVLLKNKHARWSKPAPVLKACTWMTIKETDPG